jgi:acetyl-CoA carboxylase carboxyl transferase subunit beta
MANISVDISRPDDDPPPPPARRHPNTCPVCSSHYRDDELRALLRVCGQCGYHFPVGARERVVQLTDPGTFLEIDADLRSTDPLAFVDLKAYTDRLASAELETGLGDAIVVGTSVIKGHPAVLAVMDFGFMGGSMGSVVGEKFARACDLALMHDVPLISVAASGGARMQENILALMQMGKTVAGVDALQEAGVPFISVLTHPTTGGVIASFAALGDVALAEPGTLMSFAGPRVVQQTTRETLPDDFGLAEASLRLGHIDLVVPRPQLAETLGRLLGVLGGQPEPDDEPVLDAPAANGSHTWLSFGRLRHLWRRGGEDEVDGQG